MNDPLADPSNPYSTPVEETPLDAASPSENRFAQIGELMVAWEKLRLLYNGILIPFTIALFAIALALNAPSASQLPMTAVVGAFFANLCFCAGPLIDGYLTWFGYRRRTTTILLFAAGLLFTMFLATITTIPPPLFLP